VFPLGEETERVVTSQKVLLFKESFRKPLILGSVIRSKRLSEKNKTVTPESPKVKTSAKPDVSRRTFTKIGFPKNSEGSH
jgi:hypothetical protein